MREFLGGLGGGRRGRRPSTGAEDHGRGVRGGRTATSRSRLARRALEISPDCADAYVLLAENAGSRKEALELYQKGVEAGTRALGPELFRGRGRLVLGPPRDPALHAGQARPGRHPVDARAAGRGGRAPPGDAPAQPERQPGGALHAGGLAPEPGPRRRPGPAPRPVPTRARPPGPTPGRCSPSAARATRPRPGSCSRRPGSGTSTSPATSWATSRCPGNSPPTTARATRARRSSTPAPSSAAGRPRRGP